MITTCISIDPVETVEPAEVLEVVDARKTLELLELAVLDRGADYVYEGIKRPDSDDPNQKWCVYRLPDGAPSCIVGHVYSYLGVLDEAKEDARPGWQPVSILKRFDGDALHVLNIAQRRQDNGESWGGALDAARKCID